MTSPLTPEPTPQVVKIVKKHDKHSPLHLKEAFAELVTTQPFYISTQLVQETLVHMELRR